MKIFKSLKCAAIFLTLPFFIFTTVSCGQKKGDFNTLPAAKAPSVPRHGGGVETHTTDSALPIPAPLRVAEVKSATQKQLDAFLIKGAAIGLANSTESQEIVMGEGISPEVFFEIGSISKSFAAIVLAQLAYQKLLLIREPISTYIPELKNSFIGKLCAHDLALHQAQLVANFPSGKTFNEDELISFLQKYTPDLSEFPVGRRKYSNLGYATLGLLITRVDVQKGKKTYQEIVRERIFAPLLMKKSGFITSLQKPEGLTQGFDGLLEPQPYQPFGDLASASGGVYSNLTEMMLFLKANLNPGSDDLGNAIRLSQKLGLGWDSLPTEFPIHKNGAMAAGFSSMIKFDSEKKIGSIVLVNTLNVVTPMTLSKIALGESDVMIEQQANEIQVKTLVGDYFGKVQVGRKWMNATATVYLIHGKYLALKVWVKKQGYVASGRVLQLPNDSFQLLNYGTELFPLTIGSGQLVLDGTTFFK